GDLHLIVEQHFRDPRHAGAADAPQVHALQPGETAEAGHREASASTVTRAAIAAAAPGLARPRALRAISASRSTSATSAPSSLANPAEVASLASSTRAAPWRSRARALSS